MRATIGRERWPGRRLRSPRRQSRREAARAKCAMPRFASWWLLTGVAKENHVAVLHDVFLAFEAQLRALFRRREAAGGQQIFPAHNFSLDEILLNVAVNCARSFLGIHPALDGPGAALRLAASQK